MEALTAPLPFRARTKAAFGPRLLDTMDSFRSANVELPHGWRDEVELLGPWSGEPGYDEHVERKYNEEEQEEDRGMSRRCAAHHSTQREAAPRAPPTVRSVQLACDVDCLRSNNER